MTTYVYMFTKTHTTTSLQNKHIKHQKVIKNSFQVRTLYLIFEFEFFIIVSTIAI